MGRRSQRGDLPLNADINVTSLVDVAFTLLVIFIITAPILQGGIEVSVPKAQVQALTAEDKPFFITVMPDGRIFIEETEVTPAEFEESFPQLAAAGNLERVYIRGDSLAPYGPVLKVMATVARAGVDWAVVGEPYTGR
ncbi:MAG: ExbD/TolR family protein [Gemmatimonadota bacterium]